jgi:ankyrin repeat protein
MSSRPPFRTILAFVLSLTLGCCLRAAPIHDAAKAGDVAQVRTLLAANPTLVDAKDNVYGYTPLMFAAEKGHLDVVTLLLEKGAAVEAKDNIYGYTSLFIAAEEGHLEVVTLLLEKGAAVEAKSDAGFTPLMKAAEWGRLEVVKLLLEKGANPNVEAQGHTALRIAEDKGYAEIAELLRKAGAKQ